MEQVPEQVIRAGHEEIIKQEMNMQIVRLATTSLNVIVPIVELKDGLKFTRYKCPRCGSEAFAPLGFRRHILCMNLDHLDEVKTADKEGMPRMKAVEHVTLRLERETIIP